ncbi:hypothetical protein QWZ10_11980 [Paracoccus cavernae]|uniref:Lipoprotein n=2 Tax=Paracoccus cavernae TaxID=1571207 RepID=A0ABT8D697_9RHOB|nr:hypothetical protein [Paracoccus cavernae]
MMTKTLALPLAAIALAGFVAACEKTAPPVPDQTPGPVAASNALNGSYNLRASDCGNEQSATRMVIDGNRFLVAGSTCTVVDSNVQVNRTEVTLSCEGGELNGNRVLYLQSRPDVLRVTRDQTTLTYFQCARAAASSDVTGGA